MAWCAGFDELQVHMLTQHDDDASNNASNNNEMETNQNVTPPNSESKASE